MGVIEFAQITLASGLTSTDPALINNAREVKRGLEAFSGQRTEFYTTSDDPTVWYGIGGWGTFEQGTKEFRGSREEAVMMQAIKDQTKLAWIHFFTIDAKTVDLDANVLLAVKLNFAQGSVDKGQVEMSLDTGIGEGLNVISGWNIHNHEVDDDVLVQFAGFNTREEAEEATSKLKETIDLERKAVSVNFIYLTKVDM